MTSRRILASAVALMAGASFMASGASAHPGHPGNATDDPKVLFHEKFENGLDDGDVVAIESYDGGKYTADSEWKDQTDGNGLVMDATTSDSDLIAQGWATPATADASNHLRAIAEKLGELNGSSPDTSNHAVTAWTQNKNPGADKIEFKIKNPLSISSTGRFLTVSANVGVTSCHAAHPAIKFFLVDDGGSEQPVNDSALDPCGGNNSQNDVVATTLLGGKAVLFKSSSVGLVMRNGQGSGGGNDHAFDDVRILDVTPQLDKTFSLAGPLQPNTKTNVVLTITNTSELAEKPGWKFTDHLPTGLTVAGAVNNDCDATVTAPNGATNIVVKDGTLAQGEESCKISVPVTSATGGVFENSAANIESVGLNAPGTAKVEYVAPPAPASDDSDSDDSDSDDSDSDDSDSDDKKLPGTGAPTWANPWLGGGSLLLTAAAAGTGIVIRRRSVI